METIDRSLMTFLLNALWHTPLIAVAVALARRALRNAPARHTHALCVAGLIAALLLPALSIRRSTPDRPVAAIAPPLAVIASAAPAPVLAAPAPGRRDVEVPRGAASLVLWLCGAFLLVRIALLARAALRTIRLCRTSHAAAPCAAFDRARAAFGLDRVELRYSNRITAPVTAARLVILPAAMTGASDEVLASAIGHEMAHIARRDFAWNIVCELLAAPISFHPATFWLRRQIDRTRELACDDLVAARLLDPRVYAQSILDIASTLTVVPRPGYTLGVFDGDILEERIRRLVRRPAAYTRRARVWAAATLATLAVCIVVASTLAISARAQSPARAEMQAAVHAANADDYAGAAAHFEKAVALEPENTKGRLFLAYTYLHLGAPAAEKARAQLLEVIRLDPKIPEAYYTLGFVDWRIAYPRLAQSASAGRTYDFIADAALRAQLRKELLPHVDEAYRVLRIAIGLDPGWSDALAYVNLVSRLEAALADTPAENARQIAEADEWVAKALAAKKARPAPHASTRLDVDGPVPTMLTAPPPPPPPPPPAGVPRGERRP